MQLLNIAVVCFLAGYVNAGYGIIEAVVVTVDGTCFHNIIAITFTCIVGKLSIRLGNVHNYCTI